VSRSLKLKFSLLLAFAFAALVSVRAIYHELQSDFTPDRRPIAIPADKDLNGIRVVNLATAGEPPLTAFFRPPANGRIVVLVHGTGADRSQLLPEARMLGRHGFGVLSLDWPGNGDSGGTIRWDEPERQALTRAIDWAAQAPGAELRRVGLLGFSNGSWIALQVASGDERVYALALTGAFADVKDLVVKQGGRFGALSSGFALLTARWRGMRYWERRSEDLIAKISPRPVLLVAGTADSVVPPSMTERLYRSAREPKSLWLVPGAGHGQYAAVAPAEYERRLVQLFSTGAGN
jgi:alpha-beta hydrolase superfamily lysophospholipase